MPRQGFWNGANPPLGYRTVEVERRGTKAKKRLEIDEREAATVRQIFKLFLEGDGTSNTYGLKAIVSWLNRNGFTNKLGGKFFIGNVHQILTRQTYAASIIGTVTISRSQKLRPREDWVAVDAPQIISPGRVRQSPRDAQGSQPTITAPRIVNSQVLLTNIARCEACGAAMALFHRQERPISLLYLLFGSAERPAGLYG